MKNNDSLFRKAYNNHHDKNGSDVSSTADSLMRSDIGDGVSLDGENFSNANGDDRPNAWSDPIPLGGESGGNPNIDGDFDYGYEGWKTNVLNDAEYWINSPFETEQIDVSINWAFGNFGAITPTPTGNGQCLPGGDGSSFPMNELMSKLGAPSESNPVNPERETYINQWFKFNVTACYQAYQLSGADVRPLTQWDGKIYVKIISAINFFNFKPIFKVGYFVALDDGYFFENLGEMISAYQQVYPNTQGQPIGSVVVEPAWLGFGENITPVRTLNQLYEYANQGGVEPQPTSGQGTVLGNIFDEIVATNPPNPYSGSIPSWITPNAPGLPDIEDCSGLTSQLYQMYSPYLTAYTPFNFNVDGGSIVNILNQLEGQSIGFYMQEAMQSYDNYVSLVTAGLLCAAGMDENVSPDMDSFWNNLPESCQLQSYAGDGNDGANGEGIPPNEPIPAEDGGMVTNNDNIYIDTSATNKPLPFSNANGNNNQALIQQLNYIKNWFKDNPIDRDMFASSESFEIFHIGNGEMGGGASSLYQMQSQAFDSNNPEISWSVNRFKSLQDWYKVGNFIELFFNVFVRVANCLPTDVKNACTSLLQEIMARNTEFFIVETDEEQQFRDLFQELGMPIPPNFFREYTSLEYNEVANQLAQSEGMVQDFVDNINGLNQQILMVSSELNNAQAMLSIESDIQDTLEEEISELLMERNILEAELYATLEQLVEMQQNFNNLIEQNGMLQAELGASQTLQQALQNDFDTSVMNELALANLVVNYENTLASRDAEIANLQAQLGLALNQLAQETAMGDSIIESLNMELSNSESEISALLSSITDLQTTIAVQQGQIEANTINQQDVAYFENQISNLNQANQSLLLTIQEMEMQTGQTATDLGSGVVQVQGQIDMKTGKGTIQILKGKPQRPQRPVREKKPPISKDGKRLNFVAHNPMKDLNPWSYMDGEHIRFNNSYDLDN